MDPAGMIRIAFAYLIVMNVAGFAVFGYDKRCAVLRRFRVPEKTLLLIALFGGSLGSYAGMFVFRHKTRHWKFRAGIPLIMLLQCAGILWIIINH